MAHGGLVSFARIWHRSLVGAGRALPRGEGFLVCASIAIQHAGSLLHSDWGSSLAGTVGAYHPAVASDAKAPTLRRIRPQAHSKTYSCERGRTQTSCSRVAR